MARRFRLREPPPQESPSAGPDGGVRGLGGSPFHALKVACEQSALTMREAEEAMRRLVDAVRPSPSAPEDASEEGFVAYVALLTSEDEEVALRSMFFRRVPSGVRDQLVWEAEPQSYVMDREVDLVATVIHFPLTLMGIADGIKRVIQRFPRRYRCRPGDTVTIDCPKMTLN